MKKFEYILSGNAGLKGQVQAEDMQDATEITFVGSNDFKRWEMKKLKAKFTYECEIEIKSEELELLSESISDQKNIDNLTKNINEIFLIGDGREEAGAVTDYTFEVEKMKKFYIEENGSYKIKMEVRALNEDDAIDTLYGYLPRFIDVESDDRKIQEVEEWKN